MQYLVEGARGPLPPSPEQAIALLEQTVIPHFEYVIRLKTEGKILAGGLPVGDRAFVFIIEAPSNDGADRIVRDMPAWCQTASNRDPGSACKKDPSPALGQACPGSEQEGPARSGATATSPA